MCLMLFGCMIYVLSHCTLFDIRHLSQFQSFSDAVFPSVSPSFSCQAFLYSHIAHNVDHPLPLSICPLNAAYNFSVRCLMTVSTSVRRHSSLRPTLCSDLMWYDHRNITFSSRSIVTWSNWPTFTSIT